MNKKKAIWNERKEGMEFYDYKRDWLSDHDCITSEDGCNVSDIFSDDDLIKMISKALSKRGGD